MTKRLLAITVSAGLLLTGIVSCTLDQMNGFGDDEDEITMTLAEMPAPVRDGILALTPESAITQLSRETEDGQTVYEVEYTAAGGQSHEAEFNAQGTILEQGDDDDGDEDDDDDDDDAEDDD